MSQSLAVFSFVILFVSFVNYVEYVIAYKLFPEELYIAISMLLTVIVIIIKRIRIIIGVYRGKGNFNCLANGFVVLSVMNLVVGSIISKNTNDSAYFWFSYTIMMSGLVFFSFFLGKTYSGVNWFSFGSSQKKVKKAKR